MSEKGRGTDITVHIPEYRQLGPKMRECTQQERAFIYAIVICGGDYTEAALAAGYGKKSDTRELARDAAQQAAYNLLRRERVLEAISEEAKKRLRSGALIAADKLLTLLNDPNLSAKDKARVASELLDRAGLVVAQKIEVEHKSEKEAEVVGQITQLAKELGLDPARLLGHGAPQIVTDAEFTEVREADDLSDLF